MKNLMFIPVVVATSYIVGACTSISHSIDSENAVYPLSHSAFVTAGTAGTNVSLDELIVKPADTAATNFVTKAAMGGMKEVAMGKMAQQKAANPRVKAFGTMMVRDHSKANNELKQLASANKIPLPKVNPPKENFMNDQQYMTMMVEDHQKTIALFERASSNVKDAQLKAFAEKTLPVLRMHLDSARAIYGALKPWNQ